MATRDTRNDNDLRTWGNRPATGQGVGITPTAAEAAKQKMDPESFRKIYSARPPRSEGGTGGNHDV